MNVRGFVQQRDEERKSLDVIPMKMREENIYLYRLRMRECACEVTQACADIKDQW